MYNRGAVEIPRSRSLLESVESGWEYPSWANGNPPEDERTCTLEDATKMDEWSRAESEREITLERSERVNESTSA